MKLIMAVGTPESGVETLMDIVLTRIRTNFYNLKISEVVKTKNIDIIEPYSAVKKITDRLTERVEEEMLGVIRKREKDLILSGAISVRTLYGYIPILNKKVFEMFKPEMIMFFSTERDQIEGNVEEVMQHQAVDKAYAISLSLVANSFIRFIEVNKNKINPVSYTHLTLPTKA